MLSKIRAVYLHIHLLTYTHTHTHTHTHTYTDKLLAINHLNKTTSLLWKIRNKGWVVQACWGSLLVSREVKPVNRTIVLMSEGHT